MTKQDFLGALENLMRNFVFGNVLIHVAATQDVSHLQNEVMRFNSPTSYAEVGLDAIFKDVSSLVQQRPNMIEEFQASLRRAAIAEYFECLKHYCELTGQEGILKGASWYDFVRVIRNTTSHSRGGYVSWPPEFKKKGTKVVTWQHLSIDESMEGKALNIYDSDIVLLMNDLRNFANSALK